MAEKAGPCGRVGAPRPDPSAGGQIATLLVVLALAGGLPGEDRNDEPAGGKPTSQSPGIVESGPAPTPAVPRVQIMIDAFPPALPQRKPNQPGPPC